MNGDTVILQIDLASQPPAYEQIASRLRALLVSGRFRPGDQFPTVRQLAMDLAVHHNTVAEAYRILAEEGWLDLRRGRGATVIERRGPSPAPEAQAQFARRLEELVAKAIAEGIPRMAIADEMSLFTRKLGEGGIK